MDFTNKDIAAYYNQTQNHYKRWWNLKSNLAVHYGLWGSHTKNFNQALLNTNIEMAKIANIQSNELVLDAGCGVGGAALYLADNLGCHVEGVTLSEKQLRTAKEVVKENELESKINFSQQNFTNTNFKNDSFDVIWACESSCYANPKSDFYSEVNRLLKPGGRLVLADYFLTKKGLRDENSYIKKWGKLWAIDDFHNWATFEAGIKKNQLAILSNKDYTDSIIKSSRRMYWASIIGAVFSETYNLFYKTSQFAKHHYRSGIYQYKALKNKEWEYRIICLVKS